MVSDVSGDQSDQTILDKLVSSDRQGNRRVVKMETAASVPASRWFWDNIDGYGRGPALLAVVPVPKCQGALIAAWNGRKLHGGGNAVDSLGLAEIEDALGRSIQSGEAFLVHCLGLSGKKKLWQVGSGWEGKIEFELQQGECELFVVSKIWDFQGGKFAVLDMLGTLAPLAGVSMAFGMGEFEPIHSTCRLIRRQNHRQLCL